jgi:hypothetical protein
VLFSVLKGAHPFVTVGLIESTADGFFDNGATFLWTLGLPVKLSRDKAGGVSVGGEFSSFEGNSLTQSPWAFIPELGIPFAQEQGTWTFNVTVDQHLDAPERPDERHGRVRDVGVLRRQPSFLGLQSFAGFGGRARLKDKPGHLGRRLLLQRPQRRLRGHGGAVLSRSQRAVQFFYNWAATGWSRLSTDLQIIDPFAVQSETRIFFAVRWKVIF